MDFQEAAPMGMARWVTTASKPVAASGPSSPCQGAHVML